MAAPWPGILRTIGACRLRFRAEASKTRPADASAGAHDERREGALRKIARIARPLILTISAGLAFAALLRFHHAKFEDSMVRSFQKQQLDATRSWADATEKQVVDIRRDLASLASDPDVRRFAPTMRGTLSACLTRESAVLDTLEVFDAQGATLWSSLTTTRSESRNEANHASPPSTPVQTSRRLNMRLPIELDGKQVGMLQAGINVFGVAFRCQPKADSTYKSLSVLLSGTGEIIHGGDAGSKPRQVTHALRDADAQKESVRNVELLPYVVDRCIVAGNSGLAETIRQEGHVEELIAFAPIDLEGGRFGLVMGSPRADVSVPIASHERVTYALIVALALLYFATGYTAYRSERAHTQLEEQRRRALVEDNPVNQQAASILLTQWGHNVHTVDSGKEAVSILGRQEFDLVLMDLEMPGINGTEATAQIRQREKESGRRTPIIAMTAHALDADRERCLAAGMDGYISKPFRPDQLRRVVEDVSVGVAGEAVGPPPPASDPAPPQQEPAWDPSEALRLADGNEKAVGLIVRTFLKDIRETLPAAQHAALARDEKRLAGLAHRWKGSLGLLGARRALACAERLEELSRLGGPERLLESFRELHTELLVLEKALSLSGQESVLCTSS